MREILFKAKTEGGRWIYGDLIHYESGEIAIVEEPFSKYGSEATEIAKRTEVIPDTICQFTGLTDKNGNKIWENDIVGEYSEYREEWYFAKVTYGHFNCSCCDGVYGWTFENGDIRNCKSYEVKGNVFDNAELIGE